MRRFLRILFFQPQFLILCMILLTVKIEADRCKTPGSSGMTALFHLKNTDVCSLQKNVVLEKTYNSQTDCGLQCLQDAFCVGYNYREKQQERNSNCQLTHVQDHDFEICKKIDKRWAFYQAVNKREVPCNKMKNCKNGGKTVIDLQNRGSNPYRCECQDGYIGELCDIVHVLDSEILKAEPVEFTEQLAQWLPQTGNWSACWRAPKNGWNVSAFHSYCDDKLPTLTIVKVVKNNKNYIFGGYATVSWAGDGYLSAPGSFMFSLRNKDGLAPFKSPLKDENSRHAIYRKTVYGPTFGLGYDLTIARYTSGFFTKFGRTYSAPEGYTYGKANTEALLAGSWYFIPSKVEVLFLS